MSFSIPAHQAAVEQLAPIEFQKLKARSRFRSNHLFGLVRRGRGQTTEKRVSDVKGDRQPAASEAPELRPAERFMEREHLQRLDVNR